MIRLIIVLIIIAVCLGIYWLYQAKPKQIYDMSNLSDVQEMIRDYESKIEQEESAIKLDPSRDVTKLVEYKKQLITLLKIKQDNF